MNSDLHRFSVQIVYEYMGQTWNDYRIENVRETGIHLENTQDFNQIKIKGPLDVITTPELFSSISLESDIIFVTDTDTYGFNFPKNVVSVILPEGTTSIDESTFYKYTNLLNIVIPSSITSIGEKAFEYCKNLTSIIIPNNITSIGKDAFSYCSSLTNIVIPDNITIINDGTFSHCEGLTSVTIPNTVTEIGKAALSYLYSLTNITIPSSVTKIVDWAFYYNKNLKIINYTGTKDQWFRISFGNQWNYGCPSDMQIICQDGTI